jgi:hypothetical protein
LVFSEGEEGQVKYLSELALMPEVEEQYVSTVSLSRTGDAGPLYLAPEIFENGECNQQKIDIFALAKLVYEIATGEDILSGLRTDYARTQALCNGTAQARVRTKWFDLAQFLAAAPADRPGVERLIEVINAPNAPFKDMA